MSESAATETVPYPNRRYAWFVVFVLIIASLVAFIDRQVVAIQRLIKIIGPRKASTNIA